jgi:hypothetical protein
VLWRPALEKSTRRGNPACSHFTAGACIRASKASTRRPRPHGLVADPEQLVVDNVAIVTAYGIANEMASVSIALIIAIARVVAVAGIIIAIAVVARVASYRTES